MKWMLGSRAGARWRTMAGLVLGLAAVVQAGAPLASVDEINAALAAAKPGDTIVIKDGLYRDARITLTASGEKDKLITLAPQTPGGVFLTGKSRITMVGKYQHVTGLIFHESIGGYEMNFGNGKDATAQFCRVSHCAFIRSGDLAKVYAHMIEVAKDSTDNEIDHCYIAQTNSMSIGARAGAVRTKIHHNWIRDIVARSSNGQEAIQLGAPIDQPLSTLVEYNLFDGACGDEEIISVKSSGNVIRYNTFLKHPTANKGGLNVRHGNDNLVDSNIFIGTDYGVRVSGARNIVINNYIERPRKGIRLTAGGTNGWAYLPAVNGLVANNTVIDAREGALDLGLFMGMKDAASENVVNIYSTGNRIYNNILLGAKFDSVVSDPEHDKQLDNDIRNNIVFSAPAKETEMQANLPAGMTWIDPKLSPSDDGGLVRPRQDSPAVAAGIPLEQVTEDLFGRSRTGTLGLGCELIASSAPPQRRQLTPRDVGPDWMNGDYIALEKNAGVLDLQSLIQKYPDAGYRQQLREALDDTSR